MDYPAIRVYKISAKTQQKTRKKPKKEGKIDQKRGQAIDTLRYAMPWPVFFSTESTLNALE
jgi:hypothetical protein